MIINGFSSNTGSYMVVVVAVVVEVLVLVVVVFLVFLFIKLTHLLLLVNYCVSST